MSVTEDSNGEPPPPPPTVAQNDLFTRLGLLLGDRSPPEAPSQSQFSPIPANHKDPYIQGYSQANSMTPNKVHYHSTNHMDQYKSEYTNEMERHIPAANQEEGYISPHHCPVQKKDIKFASVSSLASEELMGDKADSSPISTLTGKCYT